MAALNFPSAPTPGQKYPQPAVLGQPVYVFDGEKWTTNGGSVVGGGLPASTLPLMNATPAVIGTQETYARGDHVHPTDTTRAATTDIPIAATAAPPMDGVAAVGAAAKYAREDHVHPTDTSRLAATHAGTGGAAHSNVVAAGAAGFMTGADKTKLDGVATGANNYTHPSGDGNLHVPATGTGSNGMVLKASAGAGSGAWALLAPADISGLVAALGNKQDLDATLTALAGLNTTTGLVEQTGTDVFAKRLIGVTNATDIPTRANADARYQATDATLTAIAGLDATAGVVEQTAADAFTKRALGVAAATSIPTRADADARYAAAVHGHAQADITNLVSDLALKAPLASPAFTGTPTTATTPTAGDATTKLATTAFVGTAITNAAVPAPATVAPLMDGVAAVGTVAKYAKEDHKHPSDTAKLDATHAGTGGTAHANVIAAGAAGFMTGADKTKLDGVATGATANTPAAATPLMDGTGAVGIATLYAREDHRHPSDTAKLDATHAGTGGTAHANVIAAGAAGFMTGTDKTKLDGVATGANNYVHPAGDGNLHVPATGTTSNGMLLKAGGTAGSGAWATGSKGDVGLGNVDNTTDLAKPVSTATQTALDLKAPLASPALSGSPTAPTVSPGTDSSTKVATTAFVQSAVSAAGGAAPSNALPIIAGVAVPGSSGLYARGDHVHPSDALAFGGLQVNGGMQVSQFPATGVVGMTGTVSGYPLDMWLVQNSGPSVIDTAQNNNAPPGYTNCLAVWTRTGNAAPAASNFVAITHKIEGYRVAGLAWGTASAQSVTLAFWVYANRTGNYSGSICNSAVNRSCPFSFTVSASATWEYKTVTVPGDITGTWSKDSGTGIQISFAIMAGSTYQGTAGTWAATLLMGATGTINGAAAATDVFLLTGVTVHPGTQAPIAARAPFIMRPYGEELPTCMRYYTKMVATSTYTAFGAGIAVSAIFAGFYIKYPVRMRAAPTITVAGGLACWNGGFFQITAQNAVYAGLDSAMMQFDVAGGGMAVGGGQTLVAYNDVTAAIILNSALP